MTYREFLVLAQKHRISPAGLMDITRPYFWEWYEGDGPMTLGRLPRQVFEKLRTGVTRGQRVCYSNAEIAMKDLCLAIIEIALAADQDPQKLIAEWWPTT